MNKYFHLMICTDGDYDVGIDPDVAYVQLMLETDSEGHPTNSAFDALNYLAETFSTMWDLTAHWEILDITPMYLNKG